MDAPSSPPRTVLLVHGILGQELVYWNLLKRHFRGQRYILKEAPFPFFGFGDLRKSAARLAQIVDRTLEAAQGGDGTVDIVAHSAGGLAARYYVKMLGGDRHVRCLITLGTPHHGTYFSFLFPWATVVRQTLPGSDFLSELNDGVEAPPPVRYTSIYSPTDGIVVPSSSAVLAGAENVKLTGLTHWGFLFREKVYAAIKDALGAPRESPTPSQ